jgi:hypothetical protein
LLQLWCRRRKREHARNTLAKYQKKYLPKHACQLLYKVQATVYLHQQMDEERSLLLLMQPLEAGPSLEAGPIGPHMALDAHPAARTQATMTVRRSASTATAAATTQPGHQPKQRYRAAREHIAILRADRLAADADPSDASTGAAQFNHADARRAGAHVSDNPSHQGELTIASAVHCMPAAAPASGSLEQQPHSSFYVGDHTLEREPARTAAQQQGVADVLSWPARSQVVPQQSVGPRPVLDGLTIDYSQTAVQPQGAQNMLIGGQWPQVAEQVCSGASVEQARKRSYEHMRSGSALVAEAANASDENRAVNRG